MSEIAERGYAVPDVLVSTSWVQQHLDSPDVRIVESNEDPLLYATGHVPGAVEIDWTRDLNDPLRRDYLDRESFQALMVKNGISNDTTVVLYGDKNNWWATYAAWVFHLFGHLNVRIMDGGRKKWMDEGRPMNTAKVAYDASDYKAPVRDDSEFRAFRDQVMAHVAEKGKLIDVRSPQEYTGERTHMPDYPNEGALRGGHIPGAASVPWAKAVAPDGTFKSADELKAIYQEGAGIAPQDDVIVYCRIGERSSHTWFALRYLLGYPNVRNYDGSWTEWGNLVGVPIEK